MKGRVRWFDNKKGYGFIVDEQGNDLFVHFSNILCDGFRGLDVGWKVEYEIENGPHGRQAVEVRIVK